MSFDFKGTFNGSQFNRLVDYLRAQVPLINTRIQHLVAEKNRVGYLTTKFNPSDGTPIGYSPDSEDSYLGKLLAAYEILGGNADHDLQIRTASNPVFVMKGSESVPALRMSNGEPMGSKGLMDAVSSQLMDKSRSWVDDSLHQRRDYLERKIRKVIDYSDQLQQEIDLLKGITGASSSEGSLENSISEIKQLLADPTYRPIYEDHGKDPHGKNTHAPFAAYDPGGNRGTSPGPERTGEGVVLPGEKVRTPT